MFPILQSFNRLMRNLLGLSHSPDLGLFLGLETYPFLSPDHNDPQPGPSSAPEPSVPKWIRVYPPEEDINVPNKFNVRTPGIKTAHQRIALHYTTSCFLPRQSGIASKCYKPICSESFQQQDSCWLNQKAFTYKPMVRCNAYRKEKVYCNLQQNVILVNS